MLRSLRDPRYATLGVLMLIVAAGCIAAGTWQIHRFEWKRHENDHLRTNAHVRQVPVSALLPLVGAGPAPSAAKVEFRQVSARGTYDVAHQSLVRSRTLGDTVGFIVLTPLRTDGRILLVARGFVAQPASGAVPPVAAPPTGTVTVLARAQAAETGNDEAAQLTVGQVQTINPRDQQARLGAPVYDGFAQLESGQPGASGLQALPRPDLSNPAGGALEPQHFAYVIQWYLFALLALAAPFAMIRHDRKEAEAAPVVEIDEVPEPISPEDARRAKLADRYGR